MFCVIIGSRFSWRFICCIVIVRVVVVALMLIVLIVSIRFIAQCSAAAGDCSMGCFSPLDAFYCQDLCNPTKHKVFFSEHAARQAGYDVLRSIQLPCSKCIGCRLERSRQWAVRCMHEASTHEHNCFITLTYDNDHLPIDGGLHYDHFQKFMKRLRFHFSPTPIRFYMCGEYGETFGRPHYHALLFGLDFHDKYVFSSTRSSVIFRSPTLESLWPYGYSSIGQVNFNSAAYVARYIMKKQIGTQEVIDQDTGEVFVQSDLSYTFSDIATRRTIVKAKEFNKMSLKPGIGQAYYDLYKDDIYNIDAVVINGKKTKPPRFYDKKFSIDSPDDFEYIQFQREMRALERSHENTPQRREAQNFIVQQRAELLKRHFKEL